MNTDVHSLAFWTLAPIALLLLSARFLIRTRRGGVLLCPGRPAGWWLWPPAWFIRTGCLYDLSRLPHAADGSTVCPECGRRIPSPRSAVRSPARFRAGRLGALLLMLAIGPGLVHLVRSGTWIQHIPGAALVAVERARGPGERLLTRRELERRVWAGTLAPAQRGAFAAVLVRDLRDDDIRFNAERATYLLRQIGTDAAAALTQALRSEDWQQRQMAADVLRAIPGYEPCDDLLRVTVEGLRNDGLPRAQPKPGQTRGSYNFVYNAAGGVRFLIRFPDLVEPFIAPGLESGDYQQRLLCAGIAGSTGRARLIPKAAPILVEHLKDNNIPEDAKFACASLYGFGPAVIPWLEPSLESEDTQERGLARYLIDKLRVESGKPNADAASPPWITGMSHDPAELSIGKLSFYWLRYLGRQTER